MEYRVKVGVNSRNKSLVVNFGYPYGFLISGSAGSGKTYFIEQTISRLCERYSYKSIKFMLIDSKSVEFDNFSHSKFLFNNKIYRLRNNVSYDDVLGDVQNEVEKRFNIIFKSGYDNVEEYNLYSTKKIPHLFVIFDEYADFACFCKDDFMTKITKLLQWNLCGKLGFTFIFCTQKVTPNVITSEIKSSCFNRISFNQESATQSKLAIDQIGAETLNVGEALLDIFGIKECLGRGIRGSIKIKVE